LNLLSIDLESWVHRDKIKEKRKETDNGYIVESTKAILNLFRKYCIKTTFFVVAEIYDWYPGLIEEIQKEGHEIAYHTHTHRFLSNKEILVDELTKSRNFITKFRPEGFRAPYMCIQKEYLQILRKYGFSYDSSTYASLELSKKIGEVLEIPVSTFKFRGKPTLCFPRHLSWNLLTKEVPFGSGYFIGLLGSRVSYFIDKLNERGSVGILFIHAWQMLAPPSNRSLGALFPLKLIPYFVNREKTVEYLLDKYGFFSFRDLIEWTNGSQKDANLPGVNSVFGSNFFQR